MSCLVIGDLLIDLVDICRCILPSPTLDFECVLNLFMDSDELSDSLSGDSLEGDSLSGSEETPEIPVRLGPRHEEDPGNTSKAIATILLTLLIIGLMIDDYFFISPKKAAEGKKKNNNNNNNGDNKNQEKSSDNSTK